MKINHRQGKRCGAAKYIWNDGSIEISVFDEDGIQSGPAKLTWPNGAIREGSKVRFDSTQFMIIYYITRIEKYYIFDSISSHLILDWR